MRSENESARTTMKYGRLIVFIRHDSAEIWGFRHGLTLGIRTQKFMARTGIFVLVIVLFNTPLVETLLVDTGDNQA